MSLEQKIEELTAALERNTEALLASASGSSNADSKESADKCSAKSSGRKSSSTKAEKAEEPAEKIKIPTVDEVRELYEGFMKIEKGPERDSRVAFVKEQFARFKVPKATELKGEDRIKAMAELQAEIERREAEEDAGNAGGDDDLV